MLEQILRSTRRRLPDVVARMDDLRARAGDAPPARGFRSSLVGPGLAVIAEIKRRSPSAGTLAADLDPAGQAVRYENGGAAAVSVLTEVEHFAGSLGDLEAVRAAVSLPILRKDFIIHPAQVWEARAVGADAVLLIVAALDDEMLRRLLDVAATAGLDALVEAHTTAEAMRAVAVGAATIGINNRDLTTFATDLATAETVAPLLPEHAVTVAESGVSSGAAARRMEAAGYDAILVGEALVTAADPTELLAELRGTP